MNHYCGGRVIYRREEGVWYCQNCLVKHYSLAEFITDNQAEEHYRLDEELEA